MYEKYIEDCNTSAEESDNVAMKWIRLLEGDNLEEVQEFVRSPEWNKKWDITRTGEDYDASLIFSCKNSNIEIFKFLLSFDLEMYNEYFCIYTCIEYAIDYKNTKMIEYLLSIRSKYKYVDFYYFSIKYRYLDVIKCISKDGYEIYHGLFKNIHSDIIILIKMKKLKLDVDILNLAMMYGSLEIVKMYIENEYHNEFKMIENSYFRGKSKFRFFFDLFKYLKNIDIVDYLLSKQDMLFPEFDEKPDLLLFGLNATITFGNFHFSKQMIQRNKINVNESMFKFVIDPYPHDNQFFVNMIDFGSEGYSVRSLINNSHFNRNINKFLIYYFENCCNHEQKCKKIDNIFIFACNHSSEICLKYLIDIVSEGYLNDYLDILKEHFKVRRYSKDKEDKIISLFCKKIFIEMIENRLNQYYVKIQNILVCLYGIPLEVSKNYILKYL